MFCVPSAHLCKKKTQTEEERYTERNIYLSFRYFFP